MLGYDRVVAGKGLYPGVMALRGMVSQMRDNQLSITPPLLLQVSHP